ncbi:MAG: tetratricopeptide repeat-containing sensor histidine kinase, partial [Mucilaginibacter sp.]
PDSNKVKTLRLLFMAAIDKQSADKALPIAIEQLNLAKKVHYAKGEAKAWQLLSVGYETLGNMEKSIDASLRALKIYETLHDRAGVAACYNNTGLVYKDENELPEALACFNKSLAIYSKLKNKTENVWRETMNIGRVYEQQNNDALALKTYLQCLAITGALTQYQNVYIADSEYHIAGILFKRKEYQNAESRLLNALKTAGLNREAYPVAEIYLLLSKINIVQNNYPKALSNALTGLDISKKENYKQQVADNYLQVASAYAALKDYGKAYNFQTLYLKLKDSLLNAGNIQKIEKLRYNYELEKKEIINKGLLKDKKLNNSELLLQKTTIQRQYAIGAVIAIGLISFIVLSVVYYRGLQFKQRDNELLSLSRQEILEQNQEITAQNEEIMSQKEQLTQINNTKDKLFSIIAHDLRSPILTLLDSLMLFNSDVLTKEEFDEISAELTGNVSNISVLLDNVLFWANSQMGGFHLSAKAFNIQDIITTNLVNFKTQADNKSITLVNRNEQPVNVFADPSTIDIVLRNLISNAIKFCKSGDTITIAADIKDRFLHIAVIDTGKGISTEIQRKLFNSADFYTSYGTANEKGTGLGLNLCLDFVTINGGTIWVESEPGKGSIFTFTVPLA